jgi:hypothetical protein
MELFVYTCYIVIELDTNDRSLAFAIVRRLCPLVQGALMCGWVDTQRFRALVVRCLAQLEAGMAVASGKTANLDRWATGGDEDAGYIEEFTAQEFAWSHPILEICRRHAELFEEVVIPKCTELIDREGSVGFGMDLVTADLQRPGRNVEELRKFVGMLIDIGRRLIPGVSPNAFMHAATLLQIVPLSREEVFGYREVFLEFLSQPRSELMVVQQSREIALCAYAVVILRGGEFLEMNTTMTEWFEVFCISDCLPETKFAFRLILEQVMRGNPVPIDYIGCWLGPYLMALDEGYIPRTVVDGFADILRQLHANGQLAQMLPDPAPFESYLASIGIA